MTDHTNAITDILEELAINYDHRNCKPDCAAGEVYRESLQALYEAVKSVLKDDEDKKAVKELFYGN